MDRNGYYEYRFFRKVFFGSIEEYAREIWGVEPTRQKLPAPHEAALMKL